MKNKKKILVEWPSAVLMDLEDGVYCLEIRTRNNCLNQEIIAILQELPGLVMQTGRALLIGNGQVSFSTGADLEEVHEAMVEKDFSGLIRRIKEFQQGLQALRYAPFPVVSVLYGFALGGGCEICLASDKIVAHQRAYMGFPERLLGLTPAGGGILNYWKKQIHGTPLATARDSMDSIGMDIFSVLAGAVFSTSAEAAVQMGLLNNTDIILSSQADLIPRAKAEALNLLKDGYEPPLPVRIPVMGPAMGTRIDEYISHQREKGHLSDYDAYIAEKIGYVLSGGAVAPGTEIEEGELLALEQEAALELLQQEETLRRIVKRIKRQ